MNHIRDGIGLHDEHCGCDNDLEICTKRSLSFKVIDFNCKSKKLRNDGFCYCHNNNYEEHKFKRI